MANEHKTLLDGGVVVRTFKERGSDVYTASAHDGKSPLIEEQTTQSTDLDAALTAMLDLATAAGWLGEKDDKALIAELADQVQKQQAAIAAAAGDISAREASLAIFRQQAATAAAAIAAKDAELADLRKQLEGKAELAAAAEIAAVEPDQKVR